MITKDTACQNITQLVERWANYMDIADMWNDAKDREQFILLH